MVNATYAQSIWMGLGIIRYENVRLKPA